MEAFKFLDKVLVGRRRGVYLGKHKVYPSHSLVCWEDKQEDGWPYRHGECNFTEELKNKLKCFGYLTNLWWVDSSGIKRSPK